jgi:hypothetical protein
MAAMIAQNRLLQEQLAALKQTAPKLSDNIAWDVQQRTADALPIGARKWQGNTTNPLAECPMDVEDVPVKPAEDKAGPMVICGGGGNNNCYNYLQRGGPPSDAHVTHATPTILYGTPVYVDDPPQAEAIEAASTMPAAMPRMGYSGGGLLQGSTQGPAEWLSTNLRGSCAVVLPLLRMEVSGCPAMARGQEYTWCTPEEQKGLGGPSPNRSQQMRCTDQRHSPDGQFTDIKSNHGGGHGSSGIHPALQLSNLPLLPRPVP